MSEESKPHVVKSHDIRLDSDYVIWVHDVEQLSLDLQNEFPKAKGFSARNLWNMKKWYIFYSGNENFSELAHHMEERLDMKGLKLQQVGMEIDEKQKLHQLGAEMEFPYDFGFVSLPAGYDEKN